MTPTKPRVRPLYSGVALELIASYKKALGVLLCRRATDLAEEKAHGQPLVKAKDVIAAAQGLGMPELMWAPDDRDDSGGDNKVNP